MSTSFKHFRRFFSNRPKGFTLVELIVVSAIVLLMTTFIFLQQSKFSSTTLLRSLSYSVALSIRQAQVYGTSVRESALGSSLFAQGYGIYVPSAGASSNTYYIFADTTPAPSGNGAYDNGEALPIFRLGSGYQIRSLCAVAVAGGSCATVSSLTIYFRRPNPDACFASSAAAGACALGAPAQYSRAYITVGSNANSDSRTVKVSNTGQITVCSPNLTDVTQC